LQLEQLQKVPEVSDFLKQSGDEIIYCTITSKRTNKVIEVPGRNKNNGAVLQQWDYAGSDNQKWSFQKVDDTYYKIVNKAMGKVADVTDAATSNGTRVHQWDYVGKDNQLWSLKDCGDGYYEIVSKQSGKCLDIVGISSNNGAQIQIWSDANGDNQKWKIDLNELKLYAYGTYDKNTKSIKVVWNSTESTGTFDVMVSSNGTDYAKAGTVSDKNEYSYTVSGTPDKLYFKVKQTTAKHDSAESEPFEMVKVNDGYTLKDTDGDGLPDIFEKELGTDPTKPDTDGDGLTDYQELYLTGTDPLKADTDGNGISDANEDPDKDGLTNLTEVKLGTAPQSADTDNDGLKDGDEVNTYKTDPLKFDTDGDGIGDGDEIKLGLNPLNPKTHDIPDGQYTFSQTVDNKSLDEINKDNKYELAIDVNAAGNANNSLSVKKSQYSNILSSNDTILGKLISITYDALSVKEVTLKFRISSDQTAK